MPATTGCNYMSVWYRVESWCGSWLAGCDTCHGIYGDGVNASIDSDEKKINRSSVSLTSVEKTVSWEGVSCLIPCCQIRVGIGVHVPMMLGSADEMNHGAGWEHTH